MQQILAVGVGGFLGAIARYSLTGWVQRKISPADFPAGTLVVNVIGCLTIGILMTLIVERVWLSEHETARLFLITGILGSLTTFSTFGHDTIELLRQGAVGPAVGNVALNVVVGLVAVTIGLATTRGLG